MKSIICLILLINSLVFAQKEKKENFNVLITEAKGDLNNDKILDHVTVYQDTTDEKAPYRLQIYFGLSNLKFTLKATTDQLIECEYPNGRDALRSGDAFSGLTIKKGVLSVNYELLRGHFEHKFRFQNENFELIGYSKVYSDGNGLMYFTDFNLSTGDRIEKIEEYSTNKVIKNIKKKVIIKPLPKIQEVKPFENDLY